MTSIKIAVPEGLDTDEVNFYLVRNRVVTVKKTLAELLAFMKSVDGNLQDDIRFIVSAMLDMIRRCPTSTNIGYIFDDERKGTDGRIPTSVVGLNAEVEIGTTLLTDFMEVLPHRLQ